MENKEKRNRFSKSRDFVAPSRSDSFIITRARRFNNYICPPSTRDTEWPEFTNERDRIRANSIRYAGMDICEAMCGIKAKDVNIPPVPITPSVGDVFSTRLAWTGSNVSFEQMPVKESVVCRNNIKRYVGKDAKLFNSEVPVKVVSVNKSRQEVTVDVLQPTFDRWITGITTDKTIQYDIKKPQTITVTNLKLANGGYTGKALIPCMTTLTGEPYYIDAFIPGSQIVLNIENDFEKWNGKDVEVFVTNYTLKPASVNQMSLICSRKALLNFKGNLKKIELYNKYCDDDAEWKALADTELGGIVTGVINSSKKCGVFVEIPAYNITGMVNVDADKLVEYKAGQNVKVKIIDFEKMLSYDSYADMLVHQNPYEIVNNKLKSCILKPVLTFA